MAWVQQEMEDPRRTFSTSVLVLGGDFLEASVRLTKPVPLSKVFEVMEEIKKVKLESPLEIGNVILTNPAGTETEVIITRNVLARRKSSKNQRRNLQ
jgi:CxxC motif-containing protein